MSRSEGKEEDSDVPDDWEDRLNDDDDLDISNGFDWDDASDFEDWGEADIDEEAIRLLSQQTHYQIPAQPHEKSDVTTPCDQTKPCTNGSRKDVNKASQEVILPITRFKEDILVRIRSQRVTCIRGETGCGKSTMVPQFILEDAERHPVLYPRPVNILVTQPRRLAAKSLAERVASSRGETVGGLVGYKIGQDYHCTEETRLCYATNGSVLQSLIRHPRNFAKYTHVILDEVHMRELDSDLLSLIMKLLSNDVIDEVKIIVMSASLQGNMFPRYFDPDYNRDNTLYVGKQCYSVEMMYLEDLNHHFGNRLSVRHKEIILTAVSRLHEKPLKEYRERPEDRSDVEDDENDYSSTAYQRIHDLLHEMVTKKYIKEEALNKVAPPPRGNVLNELCVGIVKARAKPGESMLIFLSGKGEIEDLFDMLIDYERPPCKPGWRCPIRLFTLHSMIPFEDQIEVFNPPHPGIAHVILSTDIAENSITLPCISTVIDFGQHKQSIYSQSRRVSCMEILRCSKASCQQRAGRAGRVFAGQCIRLFTRDLYETFEDFNVPDVKLKSLELCVLKVKQIGRYFEGHKPSELLQQTIEPPRLKNFKDAVRSLADIGAIKANDEMSEMTVLGAFAVNLPTSLRCSRLILYGILFDCPCDALVMAAALQCKDPFTLPTKIIMKDRDKFRYSMKRSLKSRSMYDEGQYNEPLMLRNMMIEWLVFCHKQLSRSRQLWSGGSFSRRDAITQYREEFCRRNAVAVKRLVQFESTLKSLLNPTLELISKECDAATKIHSLMAYLHDPKYVNRRRGDTASNDFQQSSRKLRLSEMFTEDTWLINATLCAAFSPVILKGIPAYGHKVTTKSGEGPRVSAAEIITGSMNESHVNPRRSVIVNRPEEFAENPEMIKKIIKKVCDPMKIVNQEYACCLEFHEDYHNPHNPQGKRFGHRPILADVPLEVHEFHMLYEGRREMRVDLTPEEAGETAEAHHVVLKRPFQPNEIDWAVMSWGGKPLVRKGIPFRGTCNSRNPIGFACDRNRNTHYAMAFSLTAHSQTAGVAEGVSILPSVNNNLKSIALLLAFQPAYFGVSLRISAQERRVISAEMFKHKLTFHENSPLTSDLLVAINGMRAKISDVFNRKEDKLVPDVNLRSCLWKILDKASVDQESETQGPNTDGRGSRNPPVECNSTMDSSSSSVPESEEETEPEEEQETFINLDPFTAEERAQAQNQSDNFMLLKPYNIASLRSVFDLIDRTYAAEHEKKEDEEKKCNNDEDDLVATVKKMIRCSESKKVSIISLVNNPEVKLTLIEIRKKKTGILLIDFLSARQDFKLDKDTTTDPPETVLTVEMEYKHYSEEEHREAELDLSKGLIRYLFRKGNMLQKVGKVVTQQEIKPLLRRAGAILYFDAQDDDETLLYFLSDHDETFEVLPYEIIVDAKFRLKKTRQFVFDPLSGTLVSAKFMPPSKESLISDDEESDDDIFFSDSDTDSSSSVASDFGLDESRQVVLDNQDERQPQNAINDSEKREDNKESDDDSIDSDSGSDIVDSQRIPAGKPTNGTSSLKKILKGKRDAQFENGNKDHSPQGKDLIPIPSKAKLKSGLGEDCHTHNLEPSGARGRTSSAAKSQMSPTTTRYENNANKSVRDREGDKTPMKCGRSAGDTERSNGGVGGLSRKARRRLVESLKHTLTLLFRSKRNAPQIIKHIVTQNKHIGQLLQQLEPELSRSAGQEAALLNFIVTHREFEQVIVQGKGAKTSTARLARYEADAETDFLGGGGDDFERSAKGLRQSKGKRGRRDTC